MQSRSSNAPQKRLYRSKSAGIHIPFFSLILIGLLAVIGLGVDGGVLYRTQIFWQNTLDAAALSGARLMMNRGYILNDSTLTPPIDIVSEVTLRTRNLIRENLKRMGFDDVTIANATSPANLTITIDFGTPSTIRVTGDIIQPTFILRCLPGFPEESNVHATSEAQFTPVKVALVIDASGSMSDPLDSQCCSTNEPSCLDTCMTRWEGLQHNVKKFLDHLLPGDEVAMVAFSHFAFDVPIANVSPENGHYIARINSENIHTVPSVIDDLKTAVDNLQNNPNGMTAIREGLELGRDVFNNGTFTGRPIVILLSDGAPNENDQSYREQDIQEHWPPEINPFNDPVGEEGKTLREQCGWEKFDYYQQLNMLAAMRADLARGAATVYTIGLGDQDPNIGNIFQTYEMHDSTGQPISTFEHVKDALMARMANDQHKLMNPQELFGLDWELSDLDESPVNPLYPYDYKPSGPGNIPCVQSAANLTNARQGRYGFAQNSQELEDILTGIVAQRLRLVDPD